MQRMGMQPVTPSALARSSATEPPFIITCVHQGTSRAALHPSAVPHLWWVAMNTNSYKYTDSNSLTAGEHLHGELSPQPPPPLYPAQRSEEGEMTCHTRSPVFLIFALRAPLKVRLKSIKPGELFSNAELSLNQVNYFSLQHKQRPWDHTNCN